MNDTLPFDAGSTGTLPPTSKTEGNNEETGSYFICDLGEGFVVIPLSHAQKMRIMAKLTTEEATQP